MVNHTKKIQLAVTGTGGLGDGIAVFEGRKIIVPYGLPGDIIEAELTGKYKAKLLKIMTPSPDRSPAACPHFTECGGCSLQHLPALVYQQLKQQRLLESISRAGYDISAALPLIRVPEGSRRRASFKVHDGQLGYYAAGSHRHIPLRQCLVIDPQLHDLALAFNPLVARMDATINEVMVTKSDSGVDCMIMAESSLSPKDQEACSIFATQHDIARISWQHKDSIVPAISRRPVELRLGEVAVTLPERYFLQATKEGQQAITDFILAHLSTATTIADLYAGCGTYSFPLMAKAAVTAIEGDITMVKSMKQRAAKSMTVLHRDLFKQPLTANELAPYDALVINPPRNGAGTQISHIANSHIPTVVMVSCNPGSFERDSAVLRQGGYMLKAAQAIDQFLWSSHLEIAACFVK